MADGGKRLRGIPVCVLAALIGLPAGASADEAAPAAPETDGYYSSLEDLTLRRTIADIAGGYAHLPDESGDDAVAERPYPVPQGGSSGGYVNIGGPATSTFMASTVTERDRSFLDRLELGLDWHPDVAGGGEEDYRQVGRRFTGSELDRVGVRADVTALLRDDTDQSSGGTAWRVSGMLGSTSLSLVEPGSDSLEEFDIGGSGLLWDVGVGWTSGAMSLNAGYQSTFSLNESGDDTTSMTVLSLGADYAVFPGLSVYGELNMIGDALESSDEGFGTVVVVGTGVSF